MVYKLLEHWGQDGFIAHVGRVAEYYRVKRDLFEAAAKKYLTGVAKWNSPVAGMFVYIEVRGGALSRSSVPKLYFPYIICQI